MTNINFNSEELKVDYLSFKFQFNNFEQIQKIADFLVINFRCKSTLFDQSNETQHNHILR